MHRKTKEEEEHPSKVPLPLARFVWSVLPALPFGPLRGTHNEIPQTFVKYIKNFVSNNKCIFFLAANITKENASPQKADEDEDDEDEMKDIPLDDDDDDKQERSRWQRPTFRHSKKDPRQQQSLEYRLDYSSSDEDGISSDDESSDSDYEDREEEQNTSSLARRNSTNMFSKGKTHERSRSYSGRSMLIGSQRSVLGFYVVPQEKPSPTKVRHNLTLSPQRQQRDIKVHLEHETLPQVVLFTSPNPGETSEIKVVVEDLRSSQQFNVSVCDKWNIAEVRKAFCDKQTLNAEEFEPLFESVDIPCRLDCTPAELDISCVRLSRSTRSRISYDDIRFDCAENGDEPKCCNLDSLIDHILASDPFGTR